MCTFLLVAINRQGRSQSFEMLLAWKTAFRRLKGEGRRGGWGPQRKFFRSRLSKCFLPYFLVILCVFRQLLNSNIHDKELRHFSLIPNWTYLSITVHAVVRSTVNYVCSLQYNKISHCTLSEFSPPLQPSATVIISSKRLGDISVRYWNSGLWSWSYARTTP